MEESSFTTSENSAGTIWTVFNSRWCPDACLKLNVDPEMVNNARRDKQLKSRLLFVVLCWLKLGPDLTHWLHVVLLAGHRIVAGISSLLVQVGWITEFHRDERVRENQTSLPVFVWHTGGNRLWGIGLRSNARHDRQHDTTAPVKH